MNTYTNTVKAEAHTCPVTGKPLPELSETLTIKADSLDAARKLVPAYMTIRPRGQMLCMFHNGVELFGNC